MDRKSASKSGLARSNLVIGLTGPFGSGCSTMKDILMKDYNFQAFKISDEIRRELKSVDRSKKNWRKKLQDHGNKQREKEWGYWIKKVIERIDEKGIKNEDIVIDGFRNFQEVQEIRKIYPRFFLVAICAERDKRFQRVKDDYNGNYYEFERDDRRDQSEEFDWGQSVQRCVDDADYVYYNNENFFIHQGGKEISDSNKIRRKMKNQADDFVPLMKGDKNRSPRQQEVQMATAYAQSHASTCVKRHVGAVITVVRDGQEFPLSMGFNENPPSSRTCKGEGACYKDEDMTSKLKARGKKIYCFKCGKKNANLKDPWSCKECGTNFKEWLHPNRNMELCTAIHAEERAILSLNGRSAQDSTLYVTTFPCFQCTRLILDAEIKNIIYVEAYPVKETAEFLKANGVTITPFTGFTARSFFRVFPKVN